ncbi:MAG: hypothetical protein LBR25_10550, partial [Erysipelotrichaceae bacterium]|nr:hypothetical protein [Erysipelotrichaceae bacterium]
ALGYPGKPAKESVYREADVWRRLLQKQSDHYQALEIKNWWPLASEEEGTNRKLILQVLANTLKGLYPRNMHLSEYFEPEETDKEASSSINQKTSWHDFLPQP